MLKFSITNYIFKLNGATLRDNLKRKKFIDKYPVSILETFISPVMVIAKFCKREIKIQLQKYTHSYIYYYEDSPYARRYV